MTSCCSCFTAKSLPAGSGAEIRERAGTQDIETAFLKLGSGEEEDGVARRGERMNARRTLAISRRIANFFRRDERTLALVFVAPIVIMGLLGWVIRDQSPPATRIAVITPASSQAT